MGLGTSGRRTIGIRCVRRVKAAGERKKASCCVGRESKQAGRRAGRASKNKYVVYSQVNRMALFALEQIVLLSFAGAASGQVYT